MSTMSYSVPSDVTPLANNTTFTTLTKPTFAQVQEYIARADDAINGFCNHDFITNAATDEYADGDGRGNIVLKHKPILDVTSVEWWDGEVWQLGVEGKNTLHTSDKYYEVYKDKGTIKWYNNLLKGMHAFRINYTYGYESIPTVVKDLSATLAAIQVFGFWSGIVVTGWMLKDTKVSYPDGGKYAVQIGLLKEKVESLKYDMGQKPMLSGTG